MSRATFTKHYRTMNQHEFLKQQPIEGYLEILNGDEVELRRPKSVLQMTNGHHLGVISERPFSFPPNLGLSSSTTVAGDDENTNKRDSFIRQGLNTIRKSMRFKNRRKSKNADDDCGQMHEPILRDANNNKNMQLKNTKLTASFSDECVTQKKPSKHFRNTSLGSYFSFR